MTRQYHILSLGAGVQSTTLYLLSLDGEIQRFDAAVFSDTQEEPGAEERRLGITDSAGSVYAHLDWLKSLGGPPIIDVTAGRLGDDLISGRDGQGGSFASIPAFASDYEGGPESKMPRQCTGDYKIQCIERWIRRELLGLEPGQHIPADVLINQYMGFSLDEPGRAARARLRFKQVRWGEVHFPLFDLLMTRRDCVHYLESRVPHEVPQSLCVFCPLRSNRMWRHLRDTDPLGWKRAVEVDRGLRAEGSVCNRGLNKTLYLHRSCRPLDQANLGDDQPGLFDMECEGGCGL